MTWGRISTVLICLTWLLGCQFNHERRPQAVLRGFREIQVDAAGRVTPIVISEKDSLGYCLSLDPLVDSSSWRLGWRIDQLDAVEPRTPTARLEGTLCITAPQTARLEPGRHQLCPSVIRPGPSGVTQLDCLAFEASASDTAYLEAQSRWSGLARRAGLEASAELIDEIMAFSRAMAEPFPLLSLRARLLVIDLRRRKGRDEDWRAIDELLADPPRWLDVPGLEEWKGQFAYQRAAVSLDHRAAARGAWESLQVASDAFARVVSELWAAPRIRQANLIGITASPWESRQRLLALKQACLDTPCHRSTRRALDGTLVWQTLLDSDASARDLQWAEETSLDLAREQLTSEAADATTNRLLNVSFARLRRELSPEPYLSAAQRSLSPDQARGGGRSAQLAAWAEVLRGLDELRLGHAQAALALCLAPSRTSWPQLAAEGLTCRALAFHQQGQLTQARATLREALLRHAALADNELEQAISLGSGRRASAFSLQARFALEAGDPTEAWNLLQGLDLIRWVEAQRLRCGDSSADRSEAQRAALVSTLEALAFPESRERALQSRTSVIALRERLDALIRRDGACRLQRLEPSPEPDLRAFLAEDDLIALWRRAEDSVPESRITRLGRVERDRWLDAIEPGAATPLDPRAWDDAARLFARALIPAAWSESRPLRVALYGALQRVPITALPHPQQGERWGVTRPLVLHHAHAAPPRSARDARSDRKLFVIDPRGNLPTSREAFARFRQQFPGATLLHGAQASRARFESALAGGVSWLHFDGHGRYDPVFPELSALEFADGTLTADRLLSNGAPPELVNLSGCETGRSPVSADSGRHGLAGILIERGVRWVVANRHQVPDAVAHDFNLVFYRELADRIAVPEAYRRALTAVSQKYPPLSWGGLVLVTSGR
jgi:hypothetical protein